MKNMDENTDRAIFVIICMMNNIAKTKQNMIKNVLQCFAFIVKLLTDSV